MEQTWRLISYSEKSVNQLGMENNKNYLIIKIINSTEIKKLKIDGVI